MFINNGGGSLAPMEAELVDLLDSSSGVRPGDPGWTSWCAALDHMRLTHSAPPQSSGSWASRLNRYRTCKTCSVGSPIADNETVDGKGFGISVYSTEDSTVAPYNRLDCF